MSEIREYSCTAQGCTDATLCQSCKALPSKISAPKPKNVDIPEEMIDAGMRELLYCFAAGINNREMVRRIMKVGPARDICLDMYLGKVMPKSRAMRPRKIITP